MVAYRGRLVSGYQLDRLAFGLREDDIAMNLGTLASEHSQEQRARR